MMIIVIQTERSLKTHDVNIESNGIEVKRGNLTDFERRLLQYILDADADEKEES